MKCPSDYICLSWRKCNWESKLCWKSIWSVCLWYSLVMTWLAWSYRQCKSLNFDLWPIVMHEIESMYDTRSTVSFHALSSHLCNSSLNPWILQRPKRWLLCLKLSHWRPSQILIVVVNNQGSIDSSIHRCQSQTSFRICSIIYSELFLMEWIAKPRPSEWNQLSAKSRFYDNAKDCLFNSSTEHHKCKKNQQRIPLKILNNLPKSKILTSPALNHAMMRMMRKSSKNFLCCSLRLGWWRKRTLTPHQNDFRFILDNMN
jgi:hypothetical protein